MCHLLLILDGTYTSLPHGWMWMWTQCEMCHEENHCVFNTEHNWLFSLFIALPTLIRLFALSPLHREEQESLQRPTSSFLWTFYRDILQSQASFLWYEGNLTAAQPPLAERPWWETLFFFFKKKLSQVKRETSKSCKACKGIRRSCQSKDTLCVLVAF